MKSISAAALCLTLAAGLSFTAPALADDVNRMTLAVGYYDVFDNNGAADFRAEYRPGAAIVWSLKPWIGAEVTTDGAVYGAAGFLYDFDMGNNWYLTPSLGAGLYADGGGKDLGHVVEFRSQLELAYQLEDTSRLGLALSHTSNAGLDDRNPGVEVLTLNYSFPIQGW